MPQESDDRLESNINDQTPDLEVEITATGSGEQTQPTAPVVIPGCDYEAEPKATGISSFIESIRRAQSSQETHHDPRDVGESHELSAVVPGEANFHQERDLERAEPIMPSSIVSSRTGGQTWKWPGAELFEGTDSMSPGYNRFFRHIRVIATGKSLSEQTQPLIDCLRSIAGANGEEIYRKYAMGYGRRKHYRWLVEAIFNKIVTASST